LGWPGQALFRAGFARLPPLTRHLAALFARHSCLAEGPQGLASPPRHRQDFRRCGEIGAACQNLAASRAPAGDPRSLFGGV